MLLWLSPTSPIAPGANLTRVAEGFSFTEGPARAKNGDVYFTDQPNDRIMRWNGEHAEEWMKPAGRSNGLAFDRTGNLIACADGANELWSIAPDKKVTVLLDTYEERRLNGPNDVWVHRSGALYFTDPLYARDYWTRDKASEQKGQFVYVLDPKGLRAVATDLRQPNGIVGAPDGRTLYVSDIGAGETFRYTIAKDGSLEGKTRFCKLGSDGMTLDVEGNLYLTGHGVTIFDKKGEQIEHIDVPEPWTGNVTFAGRDRRTLFITASTGVYTLRMRVQGAGGA